MLVNRSSSGRHREPHSALRWGHAALVVTALGCLFFGRMSPARAEFVVLVSDLDAPVAVSIGPLWGETKSFSLVPDRPVRLAVPGIVPFSAVYGQDRLEQPLEPNRLYRLQMRNGRFAVVPQRFLGIQPSMWLHAGAREAPPPAVVIPIKLLVDDEQPAVRNAWEARLKAQFAGASRFLEWYTGTRFEVVAVDTWESNDAIADPEELERDFRDHTAHDDARLVVGVSSQWKLSGPADLAHPVSNPLNTHILIPDTQPGFDGQMQLRYLVHRLAHFLGAVDVDDPNTIMFPPERLPAAIEKAEKPLAAEPYIDAENVLVMSLIADDLRLGDRPGVGTLSPGTRDYLRAVYLAMGRHLPSKEALRLAETMTTPPPAAKRYLVLWTDGTTSSVDEVADWGREEAVPSADGRPLFDAERPVRWILDTTLSKPAIPETFVEFHGGDRLPGRVVASFPAQQSGDDFLPAWLEVTPYAHVDPPDGRSRPRLRVATDHVRRIVWKRVTDRYRPGSLFTVDGRVFTFRAVRITPGSVRILRDEGILDMPWLDVAELHLPDSQDFGGMQGLYRRRCLLTAGADDTSRRIVELETDEGARLTTSLLRMQPQAFGDGGKPDNWYFLVQPEWSLQALWVSHRRIRMRRFFAVDEVPLWRLVPEFSELPLLGSPWGFRVNANIAGGSLETPERPFAWGFGVLSGSRLTFPLPPEATAFRITGALDRSAGDGGCVAASVKFRPAGETAFRTLFTADVLVGSHSKVDTGRLPIPGEGVLELAVDPEPPGAPPGADPGNIRDIFDWLEPIVYLDGTSQALQAERFRPDAVPAWDGWTIVASPETAELRLENYFDTTDDRNPAWRIVVRHGRGPLELRRTLAVPAAGGNLEIYVCRHPKVRYSKIEVFVNDEHKTTFTTPEHGGGNYPDPLTLPLAEYAGKPVDVKLVVVSEDDGAWLEWRAIRIAEAVPQAAP
ncbi:hypothetical protein JCM19992_04600 [Thermostilla marina]